MQPVFSLTKQPRQMRQILSLATAIGFAGILLWILLPTQPALSLVSSERPTVNLEIGRQAYATNCARCHGPTGAGDGMDAAKMFPKPRDLSEGIFKFRTTASGTPPSDEDLFRVISEGLPGSRMPNFTRLPEETRWQLVYFVKSLSDFFEEVEPEAVNFGTDPGFQGADPKVGRQVYETLQCAACHGDLGRGNGPSAPTLVDDWDQPIQAADLTQSWNYRSGSSPEDILIRLMTGLDGTPMPSYDGAVTPEEAWQLAYYVHSFQSEPDWRDTLVATPIQGELPTDPNDSQWASAQRSDLKMSSTNYREGEILSANVNAISVQAIYNEEEIVFRLSWHDRSEDTDPSDSLALAFLAEPRLKWKTGSLRAWPATPQDPSLDLLYWSAQEQSARQTTAAGISKVEQDDSVGHPVATQASHQDGVWTVTIKRALKADSPGGVALAPQQTASIGLMAWDGANQETGRHRANSSWIDLILNTSEE